MVYKNLTTIVIYSYNIDRARGNHYWKWEKYRSTKYFYSIIKLISTTVNPLITNLVQEKFNLLNVTLWISDPTHTFANIINVIPKYIASFSSRYIIWKTTPSIVLHLQNFALIHWQGYYLGFHIQNYASRESLNKSWSFIIFF